MTARQFSLRAAIAAAVTPLVAVAGLLAPSPARSQTVPAEFFGMHASGISSGSLPGVRVGSVRLWDTGTAWLDIERTDGVFDFGRLDTAVSSARAAGLRPLLVLGQTPSFHATQPSASGVYGPGANSMPTMASWKRYVAQVVGRYRNTVDYQIWNEPNVQMFWAGSVGQMASLTVSAAAEIRRVLGRRATIVAPSFPLRLKGQQRWFRQYWHAKVGRRSVADQLDVVSVNLYPAASQPPEAAMALLGVAQRALPDAALRKPIWNTEINYGLLGSDPAEPISEAQQADYVARTLVLNAASSLQRVYWYSWTVGPIANTHLVRDDLTTLTPAGVAWNVVRGWLVGTRTAGCQRASRGPLRGVYICRVEKRREVRRVYWKPAGRAVTVSTDRTTASWTDLSGRTMRHRGSLRLRIGSAPIMVVSGR